MSEEAKNNTEQSRNPPRTRSRGDRLKSWLPVLVLLTAFLAGLVPMWFKSSRLEGDLCRTQRQLRLEQIDLKFARAALDARHGDYEAARKGMAGFFGIVTAELDRGLGSALPADAFYDLQPLLAERDEIITLLARSDPASAERLANAYVLFRKASRPSEGGIGFHAQDGASTSHGEVPPKGRPEHSS